MVLDTLLDLHAKLATVVRYYDRMLEDRLSNTYSQHNLGGYQNTLHQQSSSLYPHIPSEPISSQGGAESYYTMDPAPSMDNYAPPHPHYNSQQRQPQSPYMQRDEAPYSAMSSHGQSPFQPQPSHNGQPPHRTSSMASYARSPPMNRGQTHTPIQPQNQEYQRYHTVQNQPPPTPTRDPSTSYYTNNPNPEVPPPEPYSETHHPYQPTYQQQNWAPTKIAQYPHSGPPQQASWQQQPQTRAPPEAGQSYQYSSTYTQDSFPAVPQHQPLQPKEEALIEL